MSDLRHPDVLILSTAEANLLLRRPDAPAIGAAISVRGAREAELERRFAHHLDLFFDDASAIDLDTIKGRQQLSRLRRREMEDNAPIPAAPSREDVQRIIDFARDIALQTSSVLIHCAGGISRSPAIAMVCLVTWGVAPERCVHKVRQLRPACRPNRTIIGYADEILGLRGQLIAYTDASQV